MRNHLRVAAAHRREGGQTLASYALIVALIAIGCVVAIIFLGRALSGAYDTTPTPGEPGVFRPPVAELHWPTSIEECEDGGWQDFGQFADENACIEYVRSLGP
jgi:pilus assembly protein Flp/PilA